MLTAWLYIFFVTQLKALALYWEKMCSWVTESVAIQLTVKAACGCCFLSIHSFTHLISIRVLLTTAGLDFKSDHLYCYSTLTFLNFIIIAYICIVFKSQTLVFMLHWHILKYLYCFFIIFFLFQCRKIQKANTEGSRSNRLTNMTQAVRQRGIIFLLTIIGLLNFLIEPVLSSSGSRDEQLSGDAVDKNGYGAFQQKCLQVVRRF